MSSVQAAKIGKEVQANKTPDVKRPALVWPRIVLTAVATAAITSLGSHVAYKRAENQLKQDFVQAEKELIKNVVERTYTTAYEAGKKVGREIGAQANIDCQIRSSLALMQDFNSLLMGKTSTEAMVEASRVRAVLCAWGSTEKQLKQ